MDLKKAISSIRFKKEKGPLSGMTLKNILNNRSDYLIYFITATLGVALFYTFNSLSTQFKTFNVQDTFNKVNFAVMVLLIGSIFISIIFATLVFYINKFIMKGRKKEIGLYVTLGMNKNDIINMFEEEISFVGLISYFSGIILGIIFSQFVSIITLKSFVIEGVRYRFFISFSSIIITAILFIFMFYIVHLKNKKMIRKTSILELLKASQKNENWEDKGILLKIISFIAGVALVLISYFILSSSNSSKSTLIAGVGLIFIGTYLILWTVSVVLIKILKKRKNVYLKDINIFTIQQINSRLKTTNLILTIATLLIFLSITVMSVGLGAINYLRREFKYSMPFDASIIYLNEIDNNIPKDKSISQFIEENSLSLKDMDISEFEIDLYYSNKLLNKDLVSEEYKKTGMFDNEMLIMKLSDYNKVRSEQGLKKINMPDDEYLINMNKENYKNIYKHILNSEKTINIGEYELKPYKKKVELLSYSNSEVPMNIGTLVVPDKVTQGLNIERKILNLTYNGNKNKIENLFVNSFGEKNLKLRYNTKIEINTSASSTLLIVVFLSIYCGIVFMIFSYVILGLHQLSEASKNKEQFKILRNIGISKDKILKSFLIQSGIFFGVPAIIGGVHSVFVTLSYYRNFDMPIFALIPNFILTLLVLLGGYIGAVILTNLKLKKDLIEN